MKKIKINLEDLLVVLEAMRENGTTDIIFFEHGDSMLPAICDANEPDNIIAFQTFDPEVEDKDGNAIH